MDSQAVTLYAQILAGGTGTRLWPYSRRAHPKQLLALVGRSTMLQATVARLAPLIPPANVFVLTNAEYIAEVRRQLPEVPPDQVIGEPEALGTAPAAGLGAALIRARAPDATLFMLPADHVIGPATAFQAALAQAARVAADGWLVTFGIRPTEPETGYGYVELGARLGSDAAAYRVARFVEKPDQATAEQYLAAGRFLWNSGMFAWTVESICRAMANHLPDLAARMTEISTLAATGSGTAAPGFAEGMRAIWSRVTDRTTIDYGIMEQSDLVACVPATFQWNDVGSWAALGDVLDADEAGNVIVGDHVGHATAHSLVFARGGRLVVTLGVDDLIVVDTPDAVLVCRREVAQDVRQIVEALSQQDRGTLL